MHRLYVVCMHRLYYICEYVCMNICFWFAYAYACMYTVCVHGWFERLVSLTVVVNPKHFCMQTYGRSLKHPKSNDFQCVELTLKYVQYVVNKYL